MLRLLLRSLRSRARRTLLTSLAVVIGVALVSGTLIFTDTIGRSFDEIGQVTYEGVAVAVTPAAPPGAPRSRVADRERALPRDVLARVRRTPGVRAAAGLIEGRATVYARDGRTRVGGRGPQALLFSALPAGYGGTSYVAGRRPVGPDEVALDPPTAERAGARLGDRVWIQGEGPRRRMRLVGLAQLGSGGTSFGGATVTVVAADVAARLAARRPASYWSQVLALSVPGRRDADVAAAVRRAVGPAATVRTGAAEGAQQAKDIKDAISFLPTVLLVFAGIATFVGAFLIFNTFSITMAQRQREFALLRALGAGRRQVRLLVTGEAVVVGLLGAVLGLAGGLAVAPLLRALLKAFGADMPATATVFSGRTVLVSLLVGLAVTLAASLVPSRRATRVAPVEALREAAVPPARGRVRRGPVLVGAAVAVVGVAALLVGALALDGDAATYLAGGGAALLFVATSLVSPALVGPLARGAGRPLRRLFGLPGRLAADNAARQPGRTAVTAGALTIGLALVVFATVFAAGLRATLRGDLEHLVTAPVVVQAEGDAFAGLPRSVVPAIRRAPGVQAAGVVGFGRVRVRGADASATAIDRASFRAGLVRLDRPGGGAVGAPGAGRVYVTDDVAGERGIRAGDRLAATGANGRTERVRVAAIVAGTATAVSGVVMDEALATRLGITTPYFVLVRGDRARLARALASDYPTADVRRRDGWIDAQTAQVDQLLGLVYALLALSVVVALFGIVNTLTLSIQERVRELGLLRAVGATRAQVRRSVLLEAVLTALLGAALGALLGFVLAVAVGATLDGFAISIPVAQVAALVALAAVLGVVAAIRPARRAADVAVLDAIATG